MLSKQSAEALSSDAAGRVMVFYLPSAQTLEQTVPINLVNSLHYIELLMGGPAIRWVQGRREGRTAEERKTNGLCGHIILGTLE